MRLVLLLCLAVPAFGYYEYRGEYLPDSQQLYRQQQITQSRGQQQRIQQNKVQQQLKDYGYVIARTQQIRSQPQPNILSYNQLKDYGYDNADRNQQLLNYYGYPNAQLQQNRGEQRQQLSRADIANVLQEMQTFASQVKQEALRTGDPVEIKVVPIKDKPLRSDNDFSGKLGFFSNKKPNNKSLRKPVSSLKDAGISEIILPGSGPQIQLSVEGPLADKIHNTKMSNLILPQDMKREILSGAYQAKLNQQLSTGRR